MLNATILIVDQTGPSGADSPKALPSLRLGNVAQTGSLLYRGLAIRRGLTVRNRADYQSATQQVTNLRYELAAHEPGPRRALTGP